MENRSTRRRYWIATNGPSCAMSRFPMHYPTVSPTPEQMWGFPTLEEAEHAQHVCLNAPMKEVMRFLESLKVDVISGRIIHVRPEHPEPHTTEQTMWLDVNPERNLGLN